MAATLMIRPLPRRDRAVAEVVRSYRLLTGGREGRDGDRRTLVACSGGADSSALALVLATTGAPLVLAHVVHDMRPAAVALGDRDAVRELAGALGRPFVERHISPRAARGNTEGAARRLRYQALAELALEHGCRYVAVAHHADDQAETVLMRLLRGAGPRGLGAIAESRELPGGVRLVRPMLGITRVQSEGLCRGAGWVWREDATNADPKRLRAAVRHELLPVLGRLSPTVVRRIGITAGLVRDAAGLVDERVAAVRAQGTEGPSGVGFRRGIGFARSALREQRGVVVGELLRAVARELTGEEGADRLTSRPVAGAVRAIRDECTDPRVFRWRRIEVRVTARRVEIVPAGAGPEP